MKTYTLPQIKKLIREQGYKMAALRGPDGEKIVPFNKYNKRAQDLDAQIKLFETRVLKTDIYPDGVYYVLLSHNIVSSKNPKEFPIVKGKLSATELEASENKRMPLTPVIVEKEASVLGWDSAVAMNAEIANLRARVAQLEFELKEERLKNAELEADLESDDGLEEGEVQNPIMKTLSDMAPVLTAALDRHYAIEEKKLDLEKLKLESSRQPKQRPATQPAKKMVIVGSQEHLDHIERLYNSDNEDAFNAEMDKLQAKNLDLYNAVMERLGLSDEEEEETEEETGGDHE